MTQPLSARSTSSHAVWSAAAAGLAALLTACSQLATPAASVTPALLDRELSIAAAELDDGEVTLAQRAERGLAISPVPVAAAALSRRDRLLVGLGSYIVNAASDCSACHSGPAGFLSGGNPFFLDAAGHVVWTRNLTPDAATGMQLSFDQFRTAVRTGQDFHPGATGMLLVMPWTTLRWASDLDLAAIYAYLKAIPAVANAVPPDNKAGLPLPAAIPFPGDRYTDGEVVRRLVGARRSFDPRRGADLSPLDARPPAGEAARQAFGTGAYIVNALAHCNDCHTHPDRKADGSGVNTAAFLTGGTVFAVPPPLRPVFRQVRATSANLLGAEHGFLHEPGVTFQTFHDVIHAQAHVDEVPPRPLGFPMNQVAANLAKLVDQDLASVWAYMTALPATTGPSDLPHQPYARLCAADGDCAGGETCALATGECVGRACLADVDCDSCQTCSGGACQAPAADSVCLATAQ
jgi:cytochrome c553